MDIFNNDQDIRRVLMQLINGYYSPQDPELFRDIYNSLLNTKSSDRGRYLLHPERISVPMRKHRRRVEAGLP